MKIAIRINKIWNFDKGLASNSVTDAIAKTENWYWQFCEKVGKIEGDA